MSAKSFFFFSGLDDSRGPLLLDGEEAKHLVNVRRIRVGELVSVFNGQGLVAHGVVSKLEKRPAAAEINIDNLDRHDKPALKAHLLSAMPKGERQRVMFDMGTQLGVTEFTPLLCHYSAEKPTTPQVSRLRRIVLESCKQARRPWLPDIRAPLRLQEALQELPTSNTRIYFAHPGGGISVLRPARSKSISTVALLVGPEGGFSEKEVNEITRAGGQQVNLGENILRIETAAVTMINLCTRQI